MHVDSKRLAKILYICDKPDPGAAAGPDASVEVQARSLDRAQRSRETGRRDAGGPRRRADFST